MKNNQPISRKCIVTNKVKPLDQLIRIVKTKDNRFLISNDAKGRGAYVSKILPAKELLIKKRLLNRSFKTDVPKEIYEKLEQMIKTGKED